MNKKIKIMLLLIPILILLNLYNYSNAGTTDRNFALNNQGYSRKTGYYFVTTDTSVKAVPKIVQTNNQGTVQQKDENTVSIYTAMNGLEFNSKNQTKNTEKYINNFNFEDYDNISNIYKTSLPKDKKSIDELTWVLKNICIPENDLAKKALLAIAGLEENTFKKYKIDGYEPEDIEKDIIETIQQCAIWYFATPIGEFHPTETITLYYSKDLNSAVRIEECRTEQNDEDPVNKLYQSLIYGAQNAVANGYTNSKTKSETPIKLNKESAEIYSAGNDYVVGPYSISTSSTECSLEVKVGDGTKNIENITILGEDASTELVGNSITEKIISNIGHNFYISVPNTSSISSIKLDVETNYNDKTISFWTTTANKIGASQPLISVRNETQVSSQTDTKNIVKPGFDLSLRQFVTTINNAQTEVSREPTYKQSEVKSFAKGSSSVDNGTTVAKKSIKDKVIVNNGDKILLTIRVYNEGQINGRPITIAEYLPEGLEPLSYEESEINRTYNWFRDPNDPTKYVTNYLQNTTIPAFNTEPENNFYKLEYLDVQIECLVTASNKTTDLSLKPIAEITQYSNETNSIDRDSIPDNITASQRNDYNPGTSAEGKGYEDDDDYEEIIVKGRFFDLALRTFISEVTNSGGDTTEYKREPRVDAEPLISGETSAYYYGQKGAVSVETESAITYTIRVYNEGQLEGYADEITAYLPEELEYINDEFNAQYGWIIDANDTTQRTLKTRQLSKEKDEDNKINAFNIETGEISYKDIKLKCKVKLTAKTLKELTTIIEISRTDNNPQLADRDNRSNVSIPSDNNREKYKGNTENKEELTDINYYYKGQEDDDDFEKIILENFDLALRYFITDINGTEITDRVPQVDKSTYGDANEERVITTFQYNHDKGELRLCQNDVITFTIRIYNEGTQDGYASIVGNDLPNGFEFIKENETNKQYEWKLYDEQGNETEDARNAKFIATSYLDKKDNDDNLIKAYDNENKDNYKDIKIALRVTEPATEDRRTTTRAQIVKATDASGGKVNDGDSTPNSWIEEDDDQDYETIYVKFFDLSLKSVVDEAITIENGIQKESKTKYSIDQVEKNVVNVSVDDKNVEDIVIKFKYLIQVTNEGEIEGYASEISDYIPDGLVFNQADNIRWSEANGKIVTTQLANTLLKPGEKTTIELILTWDNQEYSFGIKKNYTEISETNNNSKTKDFDSIVNNKKDGEDDIDYTSTAITSVAGSSPKYIVIIIAGITIIGIGTFLIKRYVI